MDPDPGGQFCTDPTGFRSEKEQLTWKSIMCLWDFAVQMLISKVSTIGCLKKKNVKLTIYFIVRVKRVIVIKLNYLEF